MEKMEARGDLKTLKLAATLGHRTRRTLFPALESAICGYEAVHGRSTSEANKKLEKGGDTRVSAG